MTSWKFMQNKSLNAFDSIGKVCRKIKLELDYNFLYCTSDQVFAFFLFIEFKIETIGIRAFIQFDQKLCKRTSTIIHLSANWVFAFYCLKWISVFYHHGELNFWNWNLTWGEFWTNVICRTPFSIIGKSSAPIWTISKLNESLRKESSVIKSIST